MKSSGIRTSATCKVMIWLMTKYDELCEVAVSSYGLVTAKEIDALGIHLKDVLEWIKLGRMEKRGRGVYRIAHYLP